MPSPATDQNNRQAGNAKKTKKMPPADFCYPKHPSKCPYVLRRAIPFSCPSGFGKNWPWPSIAAWPRSREHATGRDNGMATPDHMPKGAESGDMLPDAFLEACSKCDPGNAKPPSTCNRRWDMLPKTSPGNTAPRRPAPPESMPPTGQVRITPGAIVTRALFVEAMLAVKRYKYLERSVDESAIIASMLSCPRTVTHTTI